MAWIESHTVLGRHRKTLELAFDLKVKPVQIIGHLHALWHTVLEQQEDGDLSRWSDSLIAQSALWDGDPTEFVTRLRERGWIDGHLIHDWVDYVGPFLTKKYSSGNVQRLKDIWLKHGYKYGKGQGKYNKQKATPKRVESERKERLPNLTLPNHSSPNLTAPDLTEEEPPLPPNVGVVCVVDDFDRFWSAYPRKTHKEDARKVWVKLKHKPPLDHILIAIEKAKQSQQWRKDGGQFIPYPATWLSKGGYCDEPVEVSGMSDPSGMMAGFEAFLKRGES